ncbi:MAG: DUF362 domain-containing protein, partial [Anaerolineae bacterium]|nr:DUF362 domain-containing protein [Anaerolineae bacterium]
MTRPLVSLTRRNSRRETVAAALEAVASQIDLRGVRQILVKPNLVTPDRQLAATHVDAVRAVLDFLRARYDGPIVVAEGSAFRDTWTAFANYGYLSLPEEYDVVLMDLNGDETVPVTVYDRRWRPRTLRVAWTVVESDFRVSVCPPKTHDTVLVTLTVKNMVMGALVNPGAVREGTNAALYRAGRRLPTWLKRTPPAQLAKQVLSSSRSDKMAMHQGIPVINVNLALVACAVWPHLAVIDGWEGMEGAGPGHGEAVPWRIALAGTDPLAVDALTAFLMGFDPREVGYFNYCALLGLGVAEPTQVEVVGDLLPDAVRRPFRPHPTVEAQRRWRTPEAERYLRALGAGGAAPPPPRHQTPPGKPPRPPPPPDPT